jgi:hypothetical protein
LPYVTPVAFAADIVPEGVGAAIAPTQPVRTDETITARMVADGLLGDRAGVVEVAATLGQQENVMPTSASRV